MDPLTALCLSVPPSAALVAATWLLRDRMECAMRALAHGVNDGLATVVERAHDAVTSAATDLASAHVRAAKYQARAITVKPKSHEPKAPTIFERWMAREGRGLPQTVVDQVEWACDRLLAGEAGDAEQGDEDAARIVLRQFARGVEESIDDQMRRGASGA